MNLLGNVSNGIDYLTLAIFHSLLEGLTISIEIVSEFLGITNFFFGISICLACINWQLNLHLFLEEMECFGSDFQFVKIFKDCQQILGLLVCKLHLLDGFLNSNRSYILESIKFSLEVSISSSEAVFNIGRESWRHWINVLIINVHIDFTFNLINFIFDLINFIFDLIWKLEVLVKVIFNDIINIVYLAIDFFH